MKENNQVVNALNKTKQLKESTVYTRAAKLIEERGLVKGKFSSHGRFCIVGACNKFSGYKDYNHAYPVLEKVSPDLDPIYFNDLRTTTKWDVINLLKLAAKQARRLGE
jgi:hypothetical protein